MSLPKVHAPILVPCWVQMSNVRVLSSTTPRSVIMSSRLGSTAINIPITVLNGIPITVDPSRELMITDLGVVEDKTRTFDICTQQGTKMGAWTFGRLMTQMANSQIDPAKMVENWLNLWTANQLVNGFSVPNRAV